VHTSRVLVETFSGPSALVGGLRNLRQQGLTPRGLLFLALSPDGAVHVGVPRDPEEFATLRVGEKLALVWPHEGRYFHYDAVHRLPGNFVLWNGDRRLKDPGDGPEVAQLISAFLKGNSARNVLFGCTPHQPGSWLAEGKNVVPLHEHGVCDVVPVAQGLFARRVMDHRLFFLPFAELASTGRVDGWRPVFESPLGNVLVLERRVMSDRLVLSCEQGLVEVNVAEVPRVTEVARAATNGSIAVVGRIEGGSFAVTTGVPEQWGLDQLRPALLVGSPGDSLVDLGRALAVQHEVEGE
jgi:hypothetical protein